jgi:hypothetical protein
MTKEGELKNTSNTVRQTRTKEFKSFETRRGTTHRKSERESVKGNAKETLNEKLSNKREVHRRKENTWEIGYPQGK